LADQFFATNDRIIANLKNSVQTSGIRDKSFVVLGTTATWVINDSTSRIAVIIDNDTFPIPTQQPLYDEYPMTWLLIYVFAISLHDLRTRCIPNWTTFPILFAGLIAHTPGQMDIWFASLGMIFAWSRGIMGAGDAKLWLALLWALPIEFTSNAVPLMFLSFFITALLQFIWRALSQTLPLTKQKTPAAWRTIPFLLLCCYVH
jgi:Flp pilus assembly protein protease CpaA